MKTIIAIEISVKDHDYYKRSICISAENAMCIYQAVASHLPGYDVKLVDIPEEYRRDVYPVDSIEEVFYQISCFFGVQIRFQPFPVKDGPRANCAFSSYSIAKEMSLLWQKEYKTPYGIASTVTSR